jgi:hypothetical protein
MKTVFIFLALPILALLLLGINAYPNRIRLSDSDELNPGAAGLAVPKSNSLTVHSENRNKRGVIVPLIIAAAWVTCFIFCGKKKGNQTPAPIHGNWGEWYDIGGCSTTCGTGSQQIQRVCENPPPQHGGKTCEGPSIDTRPCFHTPCPVNGGWSDWTKEGLCKANRQATEQLNCGKGVKEFTRACSNPFPEHDGMNCEGANTRYDTCDAGTCPGCFHPPVPQGVVYYAIASNFTEEEKEELKPDTVFRHDTVISFGCMNGYSLDVPPPGGLSFHPLQCHTGAWLGQSPSCSDINECTSNVHGCHPIRANCTNTVGGFSCYCKEGYEKDENGECKGVPVNGGWGVWTPSGICSKTCGSGVQRFERTCDNPQPKNGGYPCYGDDFKTEPCNTHCCPIHGKWSAWIDTPCSVTCGSGVRKRYRSCEGPYCGGEDCKGIKEIEEVCHEEPCRSCVLPSPSPGVQFHAKPGTVDFKNGEVLEYSCTKGFDFTFDTETKAYPAITCNTGVWEGDTPECKDINECETGTHSCFLDKSECVNTAGSFKCFCMKGFKLSADGKTCEDIDECALDNGGCKHLCRNDLGSYQCYCRDGYELDTDGFSCVHPSSECSELPTPKNGKKSCTMESYGLLCHLTCDPEYEFSSSYDASPQSCIDGVWRYEKDMFEIPDCESIWGTEITFDTFVADLGSCDTSADYNADATDLFDAATGEGDVSTTASCKASASGKRSTGTLVVTMRYTIRLPTNCNTRTCRTTYLRKLYARATKVRNLMNANSATVTITNVETSVSSVVRLTGRLQAARPKLTCARGSVLVKGLCTQCGKGYYYDDSVSPAKCAACPFNTYQDVSGSFSCKPCPAGTYTSTQGSKSLASCRAPCAPGSSSETGLVHCKKCPIGTYQNDSKAQFCYRCEFGLLTEKEGATSKDECRCPEGMYWQGCSRKCSCVNDGVCNVDGTCVCPRGWTGPDCSKPDPNAACQDSYFVRFVKNYRQEENRTILVLSSPTGPADIDWFVGQEVDGGVRASSVLNLDAQNVLAIPLDPKGPFVYEASLYPNDKSSLIGYNGEDSSADAFYGLPVQRLPYGETEEYRAVSVARASVAPASVLNSTVVVIGTENDTLVKITPSQDASVVASSADMPTFLLKGQVGSFTIQKYQTLQVFSIDDLTATKVSAHRPVVVYSGHECGNIPANKFGCDHMVKQLPPKSVWGRCYVAAPFLRRTVDYHLKVVVGEDDTSFNITCRNIEGVSFSQTIGPLDDGEVYERFVPAQDFCHISSNKPVMVTQFATGKQSDELGDPSMLVLPSTDDLVNEVTFYSMNLDNRNTYLHFATIIVPNEFSDPSLMILDEEPLSSSEYITTTLTTECGEFQVHRLEVSGGYHSLRHSTPEAGFTVNVYGLGSYVSYAYAPGMNQVMSCDRTPESYYG